MKAPTILLTLLLGIAILPTFGQNISVEAYSGLLLSRPVQANFQEEVTSLEISPNPGMTWGLRLGVSYQRWMTDLGIGIGGFSDRITNRGENLQGRSSQSLGRSAIYRPMITLRQHYLLW